MNAASNKLFRTVISSVAGVCISTAADKIIQYFRFFPQPWKTFHMSH